MLLTIELSYDGRCSSVHVGTEIIGESDFIKHTYCTRQTTNVVHVHDNHNKAETMEWCIQQGRHTSNHVLTIYVVKLSHSAI